jgi:nitrogen PTS system EIIA component
MPMQNITISKMVYGVKGDNASLIMRNIAPLIGKDINLSVMEAYQKLEGLHKTSMIGIGEGIAIFDWVSDTIDKPYILCAILDNPTSFPAVDENKVDIALVLISPERSGPLHLQYLSRLTRMFRDEKLLTSLKSVACVDGMRAVLCPETHHAIAA